MVASPHDEENLMSYDINIQKHSALVSGGRGQYCVVYVGALLWNVSKSEFTDRDR